MTALQAVIGGVIGFGVLLVLIGVTPRRRAPLVSAARSPRWSPRLFSVAAAVATGALVTGVTGWPVAGLGTMAALPVLRRLLHERGSGRAAVDRLEALARWIEMMRDTLHAAAGIEGAITATAAEAPLALRPHALALAARLRRMETHDSLAAALRDFADAMNHYFADLVVLSLIAAAEGQGARLAEQLDIAGRNARALVSMARETELDRMEVRATGRIVAVVTVGWALVLSVLSPGYFAFYGSPMGQLVLLVGPGALFALSVGWVLRLSQVAPLPRLLTPGLAGPSV